MFRLVSFAASLRIATAHGAMEDPRPWNNEQQPTADQIVKYATNGSQVVGTDCSGQTPSTNYTLDVCSRMAHTQQAVMFSLHPPTNQSSSIIDCTSNNICVYGSDHGLGTLAKDDAVWMYVFLGCDAAVRSFPVAIYKMNNNKCTKFPTASASTGCAGQSCEWFSQGCTIGCEKCSETNTDFEHNLCGSTMAPTLNDPKLLTWNVDGSILPPSGVAADWTASHPWRAPGNAPVLDACGVAGGSSKDNSGAGGFPPPPHKAGDKGSEVLNTTGTTVWKAGCVVEVAWSIAANHGGGYQYRLCPKSEELTEDCFQRTPLPFSGTTQKLRWENGTAIQIPATFVSEGTTPAGSTWAKNPIPACKSFSGGFHEDGCAEPQFPPPPGCNALCWGYQPSPQVPRKIPSIVDSLKLPETVLPGTYVLGFRWDCEQTPQIWSSCSDVEIITDSVSV